MRDRADLVDAWLRKARGDHRTMELTLSSGETLDAACFHAQQCAERVLKAYLIAHDADFPHTHNLARLVRLCQEIDPAFGSLLPAAELLTPYAVSLRYDVDFYPSP